MASPTTALHVQNMPIVVQHWTVDTVRQALFEHEQGSFFRSGQLAAYILRDDRVFATLRTRIRQFHRLKYKLEPPEEVKRKGLARAAADDASSWWGTVVTKPVKSELLRAGALIGVAIAQVEWKSLEGEWRPMRVQPWDPQWTRWDVSRRVFTVTTRDAGLVDVVPGDGSWIVHAPDSVERPWMHGAIRALAIPFLIRSFADRDWARASEVYALGIRKAKVPRDAKIQIVKRFLRDVANLANEATIKLPEGFDLELITADAMQGQLWSTLIDRCDTAITLILKGQNLTTQIEGGSYAAAQTHARVETDMTEADVEGLAATERDFILRPWASYNYGDESVAPVVAYDTEPSEDKQAKATALNTFADAAGKLEALGGDLDALFEEFDVPRLAEADRPDPPPPPPAFPSPTDPPLPGSPPAPPSSSSPPPPPSGEGAKGEVIPPPSPKGAPVPPPPAKGDDVGGDEEQAKRAGTVKASAAASVVKLASGARAPGGFVRGQGFVDKLAARSRKTALEIIAPDVASILAAVEKGATPDEVREGLLKAYRGMDPSALATVVHSSTTLADLAGRRAVIEDTEE